MHARLSALVLVAVGLAAAPATAAEPCAVVPELELTEVDEGRLSGLEESREKGVKAALAEGSDEAEATVAAFFEQGLTPVSEIPPGRYQCRTVKFGGPFGAFIAYRFFSCEVSEAGTGYAIIKTSGSQRFAGDLIDIGGGLVFRGADHYADEAPGAYGLNPERNAVGCLSRVSEGEGSYLLEFPMPFLESDHDVIELRPAP